MRWRRRYVDLSGSRFPPACRPSLRAKASLLDQLDLLERRPLLQTCESPARTDAKAPARRGGGVPTKSANGVGRVPWRARPPSRRRLPRRRVETIAEVTGPSNGTRSHFASASATCRAAPSRHEVNSCNSLVPCSAGADVSGTIAFLSGTCRSRSRSLVDEQRERSARPCRSTTHAWFSQQDRAQIHRILATTADSAHLLRNRHHAHRLGAAGTAARPAELLSSAPYAMACRQIAKRLTVTAELTQSARRMALDHVQACSPPASRTENHV